MSAADYAVLALVLICAGLALRSTLRRRGCCGDCESCSRRCGKPPETK